LGLYVRLLLKKYFSQYARPLALRLVIMKSNIGHMLLLYVSIIDVFIN
jgi:hypothetical protein